MYHEATNKGTFGPSNGRDGWQDYFKLGYVPYPGYAESVAKTLEFCYDDFCAMQVACLSGNSHYEDIFKRQIYNYKNVYDPGTRFMRGNKKMESGFQILILRNGEDLIRKDVHGIITGSVFHDIQD